MNRRRLLPACLLLMSAGLATGPTARSQGALPRNVIPSRNSLDRLGLERAWSAQVPLGGGRDQVIALSQAEDLVFAQTNSGTFAAFDAETGRLRWSVGLGVGSPEAKPATVNSYAVFVSDGFALHALDRGTGRELWKVQLGDLCTSSTGATDSRVYVGLQNGKITAYNPRSLTSARATFQRFKKEAGSFAWTWQTNAKITARPIPGGPVVAFASQDGKVYVAVDPIEEGRPSTILFRWPSSGPIVASMGTYGTRTLLVPSTDHSIYAIDLFTGDLLWNYSTGAPIEQEPLVADEDVYVVNARRAMTALDAKSGTPRWTLPSGAARLLAVGAKRVYAQTIDRDLEIVNRSNGALLFGARDTLQRAGLNLRDYTLAFTNHTNDRIYLATQAGVVIALREAGQVRPLMLHKPGAHPFGFIPPTQGTASTPPAAPPAQAEATKPEPKEKDDEEKPEPKPKPKSKAKAKAKAKKADADDAGDDPAAGDEEMPKAKKMKKAADE